MPDRFRQCFHLLCPFASAFLALMLAATTTEWVAAAEAGPPQRVVSFNLCADQLVVSLADPQQIAALSPYAKNPRLSVVAAKAKNFRTLDWSAEGAVALSPDLVLTGPEDRPSTRAMLARFDVPTESVALVSDIDAARAQIVHVAAVLGHSDRGAAMARALDAARGRLASLHVPDRSFLVLERGGYVEGPHSLATTLLKEAGLHLAPGGPQGFGGFMSLERLILVRPDLLAIKDPPPQPEDQGALFYSHPALKRLYPPNRRLALPTRYALCGGPALIAGLDYLATVLAPTKP
jgi:iron complex transport system substrate-binding protein